MLATLRLFKAVPVTDHASVTPVAVERTVPFGFVLAPDVVRNGPDLDKLLAEIQQLYGTDARRLNEAFHKSWDKVANAPIAQLVAEQAVHYLTTYGFEALGVFDHSSVYVPGEALEVPELTDGLHLVIIRGLTNDELRAELLVLLSSGIALSETTLADVLEVATFVGFDADDVALVRNREAKAALYTYLGTVPADPVEFLRFIIYKATNTTLLIKNEDLISRLKASQSLEIIRAFELYDKNYGLARLGQIFYRFKPLFLALRTSARMRQIINQIRRAARTQHQPLPTDGLNQVTARLARGEKPDLSRLETASAFRKVRLAYALKYRLGDPDSILYRIRNNKTWAAEFKAANLAGTEAAYGQVLTSIVDGLRSRVEGKTIYIPPGVHYGLPATEKQFTGNLPSGSYVEATGGIVCGIHWTNVEGYRVDLDLSLLSATEKFGWDAGYRSGDREVLFSGDMTDAPAPHGASEVYFLGEGAFGAYLLCCNFFNYDPDVAVPTQIFVASHDATATKIARRGSDQPYVIDPNRILAASHTTISVKQRVLGIAVATPEYRRFYFAEFSQGGGITARNNPHSEAARKFLLGYYTGAIDLNTLLADAGAVFVPEPKGADIDLGPEVVDRNTFIALLTG